MHDANVDFRRQAGREDLGWLCILNTSSDNREECAVRLLELAEIGRLPLDHQMLRDGSFYGTDYGSGEGWYARLCYHVASPIWPSPTALQPHRLKDQSQAGWEASQRDAAAAVSGLLDPSTVLCERPGDRHVSDAIAAMRTGAPHIGGDRH